MTHTSTEQPEALRKLARYNDDHLTREEMDVLRDAALEIGLLRDRVQELEASQAQRVPLSDSRIFDLQEKYVGVICPQYPLDSSDWLCFARAIEAAHGITQEKQG